MVEHEQSRYGRRAADKIGGRPRVKEYLAALMASFSAHGLMHPHGSALDNSMSTADKVFDVLTAREFCYLSGSRVAVYRAEIMRWLEADIAEGRPLRFYFDIGGGYHASLRPGEQNVNFEVGISELFVLRQIRKFAAKVGSFYAPRVHFTLVIDNICAHLINDIVIADTAGYCTLLRELIRQTGMEDIVDLLVESEQFTVEDFARLRAVHGKEMTAGELTRKEHQNVERFLGRLCDEAEALARCITYREVTGASEKLLTPLIHGVHMTQRATNSTICFRPFPGGDSRIQTGEVALRSGGGPKLSPVLLTSGNVGEYLCYRDRPIDLLPAVISHVTYAVPIAN